MNLREQLMTVLRGGVADRVPFTCYQGLVPGMTDIPNLTLVGMAQAFAAVGPEGIETDSVELSPGACETTMRTPWGTLTQVAHTETGYGSAWTKEHWVKSEADYAVLEQIIRNTRIVPNPGAIAAAQDALGDRGVVLSWLNRAPFQRLWIEYVGMETLALHLMDFPEAVEGVLDAMFHQSLQAIRITADSEAELVWVPDNITGEMTGPGFFRKYQLPYYRELCDAILSTGKLPCCHMDGMLRQIADVIAETDLPVMEAFTPPPDGNFSVREARDRWPAKALWLNFPSSVHLREPAAIEQVTADLVTEAGDCRAFAVGITENIPASVGTRSLEAIGRVLA
jgi:hypothetical protein